VADNSILKLVEKTFYITAILFGIYLSAKSTFLLVFICSLIITGVVYLLSTSLIKNSFIVGVIAIITLCISTLLLRPPVEHLRRDGVSIFGMNLIESNSMLTITLIAIVLGTILFRILSGLSFGRGVRYEIRLIFNGFTTSVAISVFYLFTYYLISNSFAGLVLLVVIMFVGIFLGYRYTMKSGYPYRKYLIYGSVSYLRLTFAVSTGILMLIYLIYRLAKINPVYAVTFLPITTMTIFLYSVFRIYREETRHGMGASPAMLGLKSTSFVAFIRILFLVCLGMPIILILNNVLSIWALIFLSFYIMLEISVIFSHLMTIQRTLGLIKHSEFMKSHPELFS
jgi:hypothetical protein